MEEKIVRIVNEMAEVLNASQLRKLQEVLLKELCRESRLEKATTNEEYLQMSAWKKRRPMKSIFRCFSTPRRSKDALSERYSITTLRWNDF